jgi:MFS family permease
MTAPEGERDFQRLWAGQTISVFGSLVTRTALPFTAILLLGAGPMEIALLAAADQVPGVLFSLFAGAWVDRLRRRPLLVGADLARVFVLASIPLAAWWHVLTIAQLYVVAFLAGALTVLFDVAYQSYLPTLVTRERLVSGNSRLAASASVAEIGAFGLGGWLVQWLTAPIAILVDALSFIASAVSIAAIRSREHAPQSSAKVTALLPEIQAGLRGLWTEPNLRALATTEMLLQFSLRLCGTLILLYATRDLGIATGPQGMIYAVGGVSSFLGAILAGRIARRLGIGRTLVSGLALGGVGLVLVPMAHGGGVGAVALLVSQQIVSDGALTAYQIHALSLRQALAPARLAGRIHSGFRFANLAAMLLGTLTAGALAGWIGMRATLALGAAGVMACAGLLAFSAVGRLAGTPEAGGEGRERSQ